MKSKIFSSAIIAPLALVAGISLTACGDDKNPSSAPAESSSSIAAEQPTSSESGSTQTDPSAAIPGCAAGQVPTPIVFAQDQFADIGDVYKSIQCNEKAIFIIRHGEREASSGATSVLVEDGFDAAVKVGQKIAGTDPVHYVFSGMIRTYQTAAGIAFGRGDVNCTTGYTEDDRHQEHFTVDCPTFQPDTLSQLKDGWYTFDKDTLNTYATAEKKNVNTLITEWIYENHYTNAFYDIDARSTELIDLFETEFSKMPKFTVATSHDLVLVPLTAWATNKKIDLKLHETNLWLRFLAGVAIIINDKNERRYVAVKGMEDIIKSDGSVISGGNQQGL